MGLPARELSWYFTADRSIPIPLLDDVPFSMCGPTLAGFMVIGWLITVFGPQSAMIRLGAGVLRGITSTSGACDTVAGDIGSPGNADHRTRWSRHGIVRLWIIVTLALCALPLLGMPISWTPLRSSGRSPPCYTNHTFTGNSPSS